MFIKYRACSTLAVDHTFNKLALTSDVHFSRGTKTRVPREKPCCKEDNVQHIKQTIQIWCMYTGVKPLNEWRITVAKSQHFTSRCLPFHP